MEPATITFWKTFVALLFGVAPGPSPAVHPAPPTANAITLAPAHIVCTELECERDVCCNSCGAIDWRVQGLPPGAMQPIKVRFATREPHCSVDGCGNGCLEGTTHAVIEMDGSVAVVLSWSR